MGIRTAKINWSYPKIYNNAINDDRALGTGIYYISRVFGGNETLIYIGMTNDNFYNRLSCHEKNWFDMYRGEIYVRYGIIESPKTYDYEFIRDVESALIYEMEPIQNTDKKKSYKYTTELKIINSGYRGVLPVEISMRNQE